MDRKTTEQYLDERRIKMGKTWEELASLADISPNTLRRIRNEKSVRPLHAGRLQTTVGWKLGSLDRIRDGLEPVEETRPETPLETAPETILDQVSPELRSDAERRFWAGMSDVASYESKVLLLQLYRRERRWGEESQPRSTGT